MVTCGGPVTQSRGARTRRAEPAGRGRPQGPGAAAGQHNEQVRELTATFPVEVAVSTTNGSFNSANNVKTTNSTHNGFTYADSLREGDILEVDNHFYNIDFINDNARWTWVWVYPGSW